MCEYGIYNNNFLKCVIVSVYDGRLLLIYSNQI